MSQMRKLDTFYHLHIYKDSFAFAELNNQFCIPLINKYNYMHDKYRLALELANENKYFFR